MAYARISHKKGPISRSRLQTGIYSFDVLRRESGFKFIEPDTYPRMNRMHKKRTLPFPGGHFFILGLFFRFLLLLKLHFRQAGHRQQNRHDETKPAGA